MKIRTQIAIICEHFRHRVGHKPGFADATPIRAERYLVLTDGGLIERERQYFLARPNFFYFRGCGRPCYLPLNPGPQIGGPDWAVTEGWPCEFVSKHDRSSGPYCYCEEGQQQGDNLMVIGQIRGQYIRNDIGQTSNVWDIIWLPFNSATRNQWRLHLADDREGFIAFAPDMWLGNMGWRDMVSTVPQSLPLFDLPRP